MEFDVNRVRLEENIKQFEKKQEITEEFVKEHKSVVEAVASGIAGSSKLPPGITHGDLVSWGFEGLIKAAKGFDDSKGTQFKTYAYYRIKGEILDRVRKEWSYRNPTGYKLRQEKIQQRIAEVTEGILENEPAGDDVEKFTHNLIADSAVVYLLSIDDLDVIPSTEDYNDPANEVLHNMEEEKNKDTIWHEINHLTPLEQELVRLFYFKDFKQKEIADALKLSTSKVCRMHAKILEKLRISLEGKIELNG